MSNNDNKKGVCGLFNLGNSCYMNAVIQVLRSIPDWYVYCNEHVKLVLNDEDINIKNKRIMEAYIDLVKGMENAVNGGCRPFAFRKLIGESVINTIYEQFATRMPCDSHEFMIYLLDNFHEALKTKCPIPMIGSSQGTLNWYKLLENDYSILNNFFTGLDKVTFTCERCNNKSIKWETYNMLKISPLNNFDISNIINAERVFTTVNDYECDKCKENGDGKSTVKIENKFWRLPPILFLTVRRFDDYGRKNYNKIKYDSPLKLTTFFDTESDEISKNWSWEPISIIDHHGSHMGGHYTAQVKHNLKDWYLYDDESATEVSEPTFGSNTYIICLRKCNTDITEDKNEQDEETKEKFYDVVEE
jgi:ubiquitin C-terminal hydrolase